MTIMSKSFRLLTISVSVLGIAFVVQLLLTLAGNPSPNNDPFPPVERNIDYFWGWIWAYALCVVVLLLPLERREKLTLLLLWVVKILVALGAMLVYEAAYGIDSWAYFHQANTGNEYIPVDSFGRNTSVIRVIELLLTIQPASFHATKISLAFIGLIAIYTLYKAMTLYLGRRDLRLLVFLGVFPSILFWSSILGKEPLNLLGVALYSLGCVGLLKNGRLLYLIPLVAGIALATWVRSWNVFLMVLPLLVVLSFSRQHRAMGLFMLVAMALLGVSFYSQVSQLVTGFAELSLQEIFFSVDTVGRAFADAGSSIGPPPNLDSAQAILLHIPYAVVAMLFRPLPGEVMNPFGLLAGLENLLVIYLLARAAAAFTWSKVDPTICWATLYVLLWAALHGMVLQNFGTSVRFRLQIMPLMLATLAYLAYFKPEKR